MGDARVVIGLNVLDGALVFERGVAACMQYSGMPRSATGATARRLAVKRGG